MTGHGSKRSGFWRIGLEHGHQAALRCPTCRKRYWSEGEQAPACPEGHGAPEEVVARRQEMLPANFPIGRRIDRLFPAVGIQEVAQVLMLGIDRRGVCRVGCDCLTDPSKRDQARQTNSRNLTASHRVVH